MSKRKEKWYQTDWVKFVFSAAVSAFFAWIFTFFSPIDESVQVEIEQLKASTEYLREASQKDAIIVGHLTNQIEQMHKAREKDDLMISVVRQLSGNADTQTIERIKQQVTTYLVTELRKSYLTHDEFAKEKNASKEITRLLVSAELARGGDRESYDQLRALLGSTNETAKVAKATIREIEDKYRQKRVVSFGRNTLVDKRTNKCAPLEVCIAAIYTDKFVIEAIHSLTDIGDPKAVGVLARIVKYSKSLDEVFAAIVGIGKLTKQTFPALGIDEVLTWWERNSSDVKYLLPDERVNQLYTDIAKEGGQFSPYSEQALKLLDGLYAILQEDKTHNCDRVAVCALQIALRRGFENDVKRREYIRDVAKVALERYGRSEFRLSDWYVYNAVYLFIYEQDKFVDFVKKRGEEHPAFEKEVRESHFFKETFFDSPLWPLGGKK